MARFPAVCEKCGELFAGEVIGPVGVPVKLPEARFASCPSCGGEGSLDSHFYFSLRYAAHAFAVSRVQPAQIQRFNSILQSATFGTIDPMSVAKKIRSEIPALRVLADALPGKPEAMDVWLAVLVELGSRFSSAYGAGRLSPAATHQQVSDLVGDAVERAWPRPVSAGTVVAAPASPAPQPIVLPARTATGATVRYSNVVAATGGAAAGPGRKSARTTRADRKRKRAHNKKNKRMSRKR
jgi:hypothetical protein